MCFRVDDVGWDRSIKLTVYSVQGRSATGYFAYDFAAGELKWMQSPYDGSVVGVWGEANLFHVGGGYIPTLWDKNGNAIIGFGQGTEVKVFGAEGGAGFVDQAVRLGGQSYVAKGETDTYLRLLGWEVMIGREGCIECVGWTFSAGRDNEGWSLNVFGATFLGGGYKFKIHPAPNAKSQ